MDIRQRSSARYRVSQLKSLIRTLQAAESAHRTDDEFVGEIFDLGRNPYVGTPSYMYRGVQGLNFSLASSCWTAGACHKRLYDISQEMALLQARMDYLSDQKERSLYALNRAQNASRPISALPDEVLCLIMHEASAGRGKCIWSSPVLAVCSSWRRSALDYPLFWSDIRIDPTTFADELQLWLERSALALIQVTITSLESPGHLSSMQLILQPHMGRIQAFLINVFLEMHDISIFNFSSTSLRSLSLSWSGDNISSYTLFQSQTLPQLEDLQLDTLEYSFQNISLSLNGFSFATLRSLTVGEAVKIDCIIELLSNCSNLQKLSWSLGDSDAQGGEDFRAVLEQYQARIALQRLTTLTCNGSATAYALRFLEIPCLHKITIGLSNLPPTVTLSDLISHHSNIRNLRIINMRGLHCQMVIDIFQQLPNLEEFIFNSWDKSNIKSLESLTRTTSRRRSRAAGAAFKNAPNLSVLGIHSSMFYRSGEQPDLVSDLVEHLSSLIPSRRQQNGGAAKFMVLLPRLAVLISALEGECINSIQWIDDYAFWASSNG